MTDAKIKLLSQTYLTRNAVVWAAWGVWPNLSGAGYAWLTEHGYIKVQSCGYELNRHVIVAKRRT